MEDSIPIYGTLKIHHVNRVNPHTLEFYYNSRYKKEAKLVNSVTFTTDMEIVIPSNLSMENSNPDNSNPDITIIVENNMKMLMKAVGYRR